MARGGIWLWSSRTSRDEAFGHGGKYETSMAMYLVGEPVKGSAESWGTYVNGAAVAYDTDKISENGVIGDARGANVETDERMFEESLADLVELVEWMCDVDRTD